MLQLQTKGTLSVFVLDCRDFVSKDTLSFLLLNNYVNILFLAATAYEISPGHQRSTLSLLSTWFPRAENPEKSSDENTQRQ